MSFVGGGGPLGAGGVRRECPLGGLRWECLLGVSIGDLRWGSPLGVSVWVSVGPVGPPWEPALATSVLAGIVEQHFPGRLEHLLDRFDVLRHDQPLHNRNHHRQRRRQSRFAPEGLVQALNIPPPGLELFSRVEGAVCGMATLELQRREEVDLARWIRTGLHKRRVAERWRAPRAMAADDAAGLFGWTRCVSVARSELPWPGSGGPH